MVAQQSKKEKPIGKVTHYFGKIGVAVVKLNAPLKIGEEIRVEGGEATEFTQKVTSIEIDHKKIKQAKKGSEIGLKMKQKVRDGYRIHKI